MRNAKGKGVNYMSEFEGTYVCKKNYELKPIGANWEFVKHRTQSTQKFPVSERTVKEFKDGKNPYILFFCMGCQGFHDLPISMISVEELKGGEQDGAPRTV